jgi:hypothetical protein
LQVFLESFANKHISSSEDRLEETKRRKLAGKAEKLVELMMVSGIPTASGYEERIKFSEMEVVDRGAQESGLVANMPQGHHINGWDVNVAGVRMASIKHHMRHHTHAVSLQPRARSVQEGLANINRNSFSESSMAISLRPSSQDGTATLSRCIGVSDSNYRAKSSHRYLAKTRKTRSSPGLRVVTTIPSLPSPLKVNTSTLMKLQVAEVFEVIFGMVVETSAIPVRFRSGPRIRLAHLRTNFDR